MTYQTDLQEREAAERAAARDQRNAEIWETILRTFPMDNPGEAHFKMLVDYCQGEAHFKMLVDYCQGELSVEKVSRFFANPPKGWNIPLLTVDKRSEQLVDEICELLQDPTQRRMSDHDLRQARIRYQSTYSLAQLRARLVELLLKKEWARKSPEQIRADLAVMRQNANANNTWLPFEKLPAVIEGLSAAEYLRHAAKYELQRFKYFVSRYGNPQVTAVMNSR